MVLLSNNRILKLPYITCLNYVTKIRPPRSELFSRLENVEVDKTVAEGCESNVIKHRKHPGIFFHSSIKIPLKFEVALLNSSSDAAVEMLRTPAAELYRYLKDRRLALPDNLLEAKTAEIRKLVVNKMIEERRQECPGLTDEELEFYIDSRQRRIDRIVYQRMGSINDWRAIDYGSVAKCLTYALARFAPDYAILRRIFDELKKRDDKFSPKSVFDFGSGVGSTIWAAEGTWPDTVAEFHCVDTCDAMNETLNLLVRNGEHNGPSLFKSTIYTRQFMSYSTERKHDIVISAFSLMEIPSYNERLKMIAALWEKTKDYLILVENGNRYGFTIMLEARDYILAGGHEVSRQKTEQIFIENNLEYEEIRPILNDKRLTEAKKYEILKEKYKNIVEIPTLFSPGYVYAPCPHDFGCPKMADTLPCKFEQHYFSLMVMDHAQKMQREYFCYLVLKKGVRNEGDVSVQWPRIVFRPRINTHFVRCDLCTPKGVLAEVGFTKAKRGRHLYRIARNSNWGDLLPMYESNEASGHLEGQSLNKEVDDRFDDDEEFVEDEEIDDDDQSFIDEKSKK